MPFAKRHEEIIKKTTIPSPLKMWLNIIVLSVLMFIGGAFYLFSRGGVFDLYTANKVLAAEAFAFVGLSLALSGLVYFWDFADTKIIYRKFLGLFGFGLAALHAITALFLLPERLGFKEIGEHKISIAFGLAALLILAIMAAISNRYFFYELGSRRWRFLMRFGYLAFIFALIHFSALKYKEWTEWFDSLDPALPPLSLLAALFGMGVVILRFALLLSIRKKKRGL